MRIFAYGPVLSGSVRARLLRLALLLLLPGLLISVLLTEQVFVTERQGAATALLETARGLSQVIDREFAQADVLLRTLAAIENAHQLDLPAFDRLARQAAVMGGAVVMRDDAAGQELVDTGLPPGAPLPRGTVIPGPGPDAPPAEGDRLRIIGPLPGLQGRLEIQILYNHPVSYAGKPVTLELCVPTDAIGAVLSREKLPQGWVAAVLSRDGLVVARTQRGASFAGRPAHAALTQAIARAPEGVRDGTSLDNIPVLVAYHRSDRTNWTVAVNSPRLLTAEAGLYSTKLLVWAGSCAILLGMMGAIHVANGIAGRIEAMANAARRLGATESWTPIPVGLDEADAVSDALRLAAQALSERREALSDLNATLAAKVETRTAELAAANAALDTQRQELRILLDHMPIGVVVHETARVVFANGEARRLLSLPMQGPAGAGIFPAFRRGQTALEAAEQPWAQAASGTMVERALLNVERPEGGQTDLEVTAIPLLRDSSGGIARTLTILQDVTARLEAEEARRRSQRLEAVGQLTGGVAHEFNNLLMAVSGCLELMAPFVQTGRGPRLLANAQRATDRGSRLTRQLLAFARRQHLQPEPVDLNLLVAGMTELLEGTLGRGVEIVTDLDPETWPAMADAPQLELVLLNLSINARDAMPAGGRLTLRTGNAHAGPARRAEDPPAGDHAVLSVSDTGTGMPPYVLARVFEPFFTTKDIGFGSGLGLPQVLGVAQQLGGGVSIDTAPGRGTTINVFLPRATAKPGRPRPAEPKPGALEWLAGLRLLVVDDDADVRDITKDMLCDMGAAVATADSAASALLHLRTGAPVDLILADLTMPHASGLSLARDVATFLPDLPIVLMTGYGASAAETAGPNIRATLQKPFRAEALGRVLAGVLGRAAVAVGE
jgi:signal transduction histidine kinase